MSLACLDCGSQVKFFQILEIQPSGRRKIRYLCSCGIPMDIWE